MRVKQAAKIPDDDVVLLAAFGQRVDRAAEELVPSLAPAFFDQELLDGQAEFSFPEFHSATVLDRGKSGKRGFRRRGAA